MKKSKAFTLVELLVVLVMIALVGILFVPVLQSAQQGGHLRICRQNVRKVARACLAYAEDWDGYGPPENHLEAPMFYNALAPYLGGSPDDPIEEQIWYRTNGCPTWREAAWAVVWNVSLGINNHLCNPWSHQREWHKLTEIEDPAEVIIAHDNWISYTNHGPFPPSGLRVCVSGAIKGDVVLVYPRHNGKGLNFGFLDGHANFHPYVTDEDGHVTDEDGLPTFKGREMRLTPN